MVAGPGSKAQRLRLRGLGFKFCFFGAGFKVYGIGIKDEGCATSQEALHSRGARLPHLFRACRNQGVRCGVDGLGFRV